MNSTMNTYFKSIPTLMLAALFVASYNVLMAFPPAEEQPGLLWKIEGNGIQPSYIFGTMHILSQEDFSISKEVKTSFENSEQIVMELDMDNPNMQTQMMQHVQMKEGSTLDQFLSEEEMKQLDAELKSIMGDRVNARMFNTWMPAMTASSFLFIKAIEGKPASFEMTFTQMAKQQGKEVQGLETIEEQLNLFHNIAYQEQASMLKDYLNNPEEVKSEFNKMANLYLNANIDDLYQFVNDQTNATAMDPAVLIDQRNENWISKIGQLAKNQSTFFAVGAGHLGGQKGVINLLKDAGYTVSPVTAPAVAEE